MAQRAGRDEGSRYKNNLVRSTAMQDRLQLVCLHHLSATSMSTLVEVFTTQGIIRHPKPSS